MRRKPNTMGLSLKETGLEKSLFVELVGNWRVAPAESRRRSSNRFRPNLNHKGEIGPHMVQRQSISVVASWSCSVKGNSPENHPTQIPVSRVSKSWPAASLCWHVLEECSVPTRLIELFLHNWVAPQYWHWRRRQWLVILFWHEMVSIQYFEIIFNSI